MESLAEYTASCPKCDRNRYLIDDDGDGATARICDDCFETCPACQGAEYIYEKNDQGYEVARRCSVCGALKRRIELFNEASIPRRHSDSTLLPSSFQCQYRGDDGPKGKSIGNLKDVRSRLDLWRRRFVPGERGLLLHGKVGTGKTHLMAGIIRYLTLEKGIAAKFVEFTHLLSDIRRQFDQGRGRSAVLGPITRYPVLAIDELGKGRNNEWQKDIIDEIISKRYNQSLTTVFTTNYPLEADDIPSGDSAGGDFVRKATTSTLRERVGARVYSRLYDMADFIELDAPDYRRRGG